MRKHIINLPWPHRDLSPNARVHWSKKSKQAKSARQMAWAEMISFKDKGDVHLGFFFYPPDRRRRDLDNMFAMCKPYIDGIADAIKIDDEHYKMSLEKLEHVKGGKVVIEITIT